MCVGAFKETQARAERTVSDPHVVEGIKLLTVESWSEKHTSELCVLHAGAVSITQIRARSEIQFQQSG